MLQGSRARRSVSKQDSEDDDDMEISSPVKKRTAVKEEDGSTGQDKAAAKGKGKAAAKGKGKAAAAAKGKKGKKPAAKGASFDRLKL